MIDMLTTKTHHVHIRAVSKRYKTPAGDFLALNDIDLDLEQGKFIAVIGKSGSGKSTLLNMIAGIDRPSDGEVHIKGTPVHSLSENQLAIWRGQNVGIVFQFFQLLPTLSVIDNVMLPMDFAKSDSPKDSRIRAMTLLDRVGLVDQADKLPFMLSGGEQQRVAIVRAIANDPPLVVADEPTGNLDSSATSVVVELLMSLVRAGKTVVMVTHDHQLLEHADQVVSIADGQLVGSRSGSSMEKAHA